jgi:hypothetical protein
MTPGRVAGPERSDIPGDEDMGGGWRFAKQTQFRGRDR